MTTQRELQREAARLARLLRQRGRKLVLAESCTGGLASAMLAAVPGISRHFCGSSVVDREKTKHGWLGIPAALLQSPGPVSAEVAAEMALQVLRRTPEADLAVAVTGHLGPEAPPRQDGLVFVATAWREPATQQLRHSTFRHRLSPAQPAPGPSNVLQIRRRRQREAAGLVLSTACRLIEKPPGL